MIEMIAVFVAILLFLFTIFSRYRTATIGTGYQTTIDERYANKPSFAKSIAV
jgi:hypothetical protein